MECVYGTLLNAIWSVWNTTPYEACRVPFPFFPLRRPHHQRQDRLHQCLSTGDRAHGGPFGTDGTSWSPGPTLPGPLPPSIRSANVIGSRSRAEFNPAPRSMDQLSHPPIHTRFRNDPSPLNNHQDPEPIHDERRSPHDLVIGSTNASPQHPSGPSGQICTSSVPAQLHFTIPELAIKAPKRSAVDANAIRVMNQVMSDASVGQIWWAERQAGGLYLLSIIL